MRVNVIVKLNDEEKSQSVILLQKPDTCPLCHQGIDPRFIHGLWDQDKHRDSLQVVFRCPIKDCQRFFISYFQSDVTSGSFRFRFIISLPMTKIGKKFSNTIKEISENFCKIYNESFSAEQDGLMEICGVGYRKSLEFLIKDYLIKNKPDKNDEIKKKFLGKCISQYVDDPRIKKVAQRAAWLGNDETHYLRKWEEKDLNDLKKLIALTVHWIEMEQLTEELVQEMPET